MCRNCGDGSTAPASVFVPTVYLTEGGSGQLVALTYHGVMLVLIFEEGAQLDARMLESVRVAATKQEDGLLFETLRPCIKHSMFICNCYASCRRPLQ